MIKTRAFLFTAFIASLTFGLPSAAETNYPVQLDMVELVSVRWDVSIQPANQSSSKDVMPLSFTAISHTEDGLTFSYGTQMPYIKSADVSTGDSGAQAIKYEASAYNFGWHLNLKPVKSDDSKLSIIYAIGHSQPSQLVSPLTAIHARSYYGVIDTSSGTSILCLEEDRARVIVGEKQVNHCLDNGFAMVKINAYRM